MQQHVRTPPERRRLVHHGGGTVEPESLYQRFLTFRQRLGFEVLPTTGG
jgi:hypothetical protein